jgi:hypothetical protein
MTFQRGPGSTGYPVEGNRTHLREKLALLKREQDHVTALEQAQQRSNERLREIAHRLHEAELALAEIQRDEPLRRTYQFVNQEVVEDQADTIAATTVVEKLTGEHDECSMIDDTLVAEIATAQQRIRYAHNDVRRALAAIVNDSPELRYLLDEQDRHFAAIRGIKKACQIIANALGGDTSSEFLSRYQNNQPVNPEIVGYPIDETPAEQWAKALNAILIDPDTELP